MSTIHVHVVSDATGVGTERLARAALVQFRRRLTPVFHRHPFVDSSQELERILDEVEAHQGVVLYTMNDEKLRQWLEDAQYERAVEFIDMLGPLFRRIGRKYQTRPLLDSNLLTEALGAKELRLAQATDFTLAHDDGKGVETLGMADIIILGVSRTSKTPTSIYLSNHYFLKVANVPLIPEVEPPPKIFTLKRPHIVGLTISPEKLAHVRRNRFKAGVVDNYYDIKTINRELLWAEKIFKRIKGINVIDVTDRTVEEVSNMIVESAPDRITDTGNIIA
jgi:regulator of PEP synthase PpsR (kinase-PPPase family)